MTPRISRRNFALAASLAPLAARAQSPALTANQVVERIQQKLAAEGVNWGPSNFDRFHLGDPDTPVTGIATTFEPTFDVLKRALAAHKNMVISHESTWWDGFDPVQVMLSDPVCQAKIKFADANKMVVWRIHDHWHRRRPDPIFVGLAAKLAWQAYYNMDTRPRRYTIPDASLEDVARHIQERLGTRNVVVVGDPAQRIRTVGDCAHILSSVLPALRSCDAALVGETPEHDTFEYVRDALALGQKKAVLMISHEGLEEWGMETCAEWLKPAFPGLPIEWISTGDPFEVPAIHS